MDLTEVQWRVIEPLLPPEQTQAIKRRGRPWREARAVLNGILWIMRTGAQWDELPKKYPPYQTCHRRFQQWVMDGTFEKILREVARDLHERGRIDVSECFIDGSFAGAKKRGLLVGKTKRGKGTKVMAIADRHGLPVAVTIDSASPHEVTLVEDTLEAMIVEELPENLIGDKAYDSDPLDERLAREYGVRLLSPQRRATQNVGRRSTSSSIQATLEDRASLRLALQLPTAHHSTRVLPDELPRLPASRLRHVLLRHL
jgi:transposase